MQRNTFARRQHILQRTLHEIGNSNLPLAAVRRPERADAVERGGQRDHRSRRQRHADVAADGRRVPDLEGSEKGAAALLDQRAPRSSRPVWRRRRAARWCRWRRSPARSHRRSAPASRTSPRSISRVSLACGSENSQVPPPRKASPSRQPGSSPRPCGRATSVMVFRSMCGAGANCAGPGFARAGTRAGMIEGETLETFDER